MATVCPPNRGERSTRMLVIPMNGLQWTVLIASDVVGGRKGQLPKIVACRKKFSCLPKIPNLGLEPGNSQFWGNLGTKIEHSSTHNLLCRKFAAVYWKIATLCALLLVFFKPTTLLFGPMFQQEPEDLSLSIVGSSFEIQQRM